MSAWLETTLAGIELEDWLATKRQASLKLLQQARWPNRKLEAWRYTPVRALEKSQFIRVGSSQADLLAPIDGLECIDIVVQDGRPLLPSSLPKGLSVSALSQPSTLGQSLFSAIKPERHVFGLLNDVLAGDGLVIDVAADCHIEKPLRIVCRVSEAAQAHARVLVRVGARSKVTVIEHAEGSAASFATCFSEYSMGTEAELEHYRFALQTEKALSVGGCHFSLSDKSSLNSTLVGFGSELSRLDVDVIHAGEFAHAKMNAIYLLDGSELFDLHTTIEHAKPNGTTEENVRGIVADKAKAVFNGRIHIHRDAQKTLAELNNRNLLLSDGAEINTKPELEIYADDVRCAHGATVAEIDKQALYYLQARGISRSQAQVMLNFGFINELVDDMPNAALAAWLRPLLRDRFARMEVK